MPFTKETARLGLLAKKRKEEAARLESESRIADAEAAREEARKNDHKQDARERLNDLPNLVQDAVVQRKQKGEDTAATEKAMEMLTRVVDMLDRRIAVMETNQPKVVRQETLLRCSTCSQPVQNPTTKRGVCNGEHRFIKVQPAQMDLWRYFQAVQWNGVSYIGACMVPAAIADDIMAQVGRWEAMERKKFIDGGKVYGEIGDVNRLTRGQAPII